MLSFVTDAIGDSPLKPTSVKLCNNLNVGVLECCKELATLGECRVFKKNGSSCWGPNRWSHGARDVHHPLKNAQQSLKYCFIKHLNTEEGYADMVHNTMTLCLYARSRFRPSSLLHKEVIAPCGTSVPCQLRPMVRRHGRGVPWAGGDPCMTGCLENPLASPVLAQSWSQTATHGACFSTTALLSGRARPRCLCVLRLSGSEPKTRRTGA